jgi:hypothetical protein
MTSAAKGSICEQKRFTSVPAPVTLEPKPLMELRGSKIGPD